MDVKDKYILKVKKMDDRRESCELCCFYNPKTGCMCGEDRSELDSKIGACSSISYYIERQYYKPIILADGLEVIVEKHNYWESDVIDQHKGIIFLKNEYDETTKKNPFSKVKQTIAICLYVGDSINKQRIKQ